ncbi:MAG: hypothetical protein KatS3mg110_4208 [Pirellulaceae bacterium]|nr:MAG: hypothetical protein KatS3mg110_4208 [Pirellulaceae bacterium]
MMRVAGEQNYQPNQSRLAPVTCCRKTAGGHRHWRCGYTLVHSLVYISGSAVFLALLAMMFHRVFQDTQRLEQLYASQHELLRFVRTIRDDVLQGGRVSFESGRLVLLFDQPAGPPLRVEYEPGPHDIRRRETADSQAAPQSTTVTDSFHVPAETFSWRAFEDGTGELTFGTGDRLWVICLRTAARQATDQATSELPGRTTP